MQHSVPYQAYLLLNPLRVWEFPDAHLTQQYTETVNIDLSKRRNIECDQQDNIRIDSQRDV